MYVGCGGRVVERRTVNQEDGDSIPSTAVSKLKPPNLVYNKGKRSRIFPFVLNLLKRTLLVFGLRTKRKLVHDIGTMNTQNPSI